MLQIPALHKLQLLPLCQYLLTASLLMVELQQGNG